MSLDELDISSVVGWEQGLPYPQWDLVDAWIHTQVHEHASQEAWNDVLRQWLDTLAESLAGCYCVDESPHFLLLAPQEFPRAQRVLRLAEKARTALLRLTGVTSFASSGKHVAIVLGNREVYYDYISPFYSEGEFGGSGGICVRVGYPHIVVCGQPSEQVERTLAHELKHASLTHRTLPQWIEEGLAQMFEHDMVGGTPFTLTTEMARDHKRHWNEHGLDPFWRGDGFHQADEGQKLSYQLAEVLMRLLCTEHRPRWFGLDKRRPARLLQFLAAAQYADAGEAAAHAHLGMSLHFLAQQFLGSGDWRPSS